MSAVDSLDVRLDVPAAVRAGLSVPVTLRVTNTSRQAVELYLAGRTPVFDVVVTRADGRAVWRRLRDAVVPAIVQVRVLAPGETLRLRTTWTQRDDERARVEPGRYLLRAALLTDGAPLESPSAPLEIREG